MPLPAPVGANDRLGLTLFFAVVLHAIFILGVRFDIITLPLKNPFPAMEITLVTSRAQQAPDQADFLAQANQYGGGNTDERAHPVTPPPTAEFAQQEPMATLQLAPDRPQIKNKLMAQTPSPHKTEANQEDKQEAPADAPSAADLVARSLQIASLSAEINESREAYAKRPREAFISAATREYKYASYMEAWRRKVEEIGNLNYPDAARRNNLSGSLILDVALNPDGKVHSIALRRSSGHKVLDDAAIAIVKLAAPYAPFPDNIRKDTDVLHITRTWQFLRENRLSSTN